MKEPSNQRPSPPLSTTHINGRHSLSSNPGRGSIATVIYRGPLERSRLGYLLEASAHAFGDVVLLWLAPHIQTADFAKRLEGFELFLRRYPFVAASHVLDGRSTSIIQTIARIVRLVGMNRAPTVAIGFTGIWYARPVARGSLIWCVNGIPEERLLLRDSRMSRAYVSGLWRTTLTGRPPQLLVTVSEQMARLIADRHQGDTFFVAPNCVDLETFRPKKYVNPNYVTYLGTAAPWQSLGYLSRVWGALARKSPSLRFRVISRDPRSQVLGAEISPASIEFVATESPDVVARYLWEGSAGFLLRKPHIANRVAFPTKFGEYVAARVPVIATDVGWDVTRFIRKSRCGLVLDSQADPTEAAGLITSFLDAQRKDASARAGCKLAAELLDRRLWVERLSEEMRRVATPPVASK
jgi:glycosyltransferase involved in cell wall biosynthesis